MPICTRCGEDKSIEAYCQTKNHGKPYRRAQCKSCNNKTRRKTHLRLTYGLSLEDFEKMRVEQDNACKICHRQFLGRIDIDHDHKTGVVRGLLCINCNGGLGNFQDSIDLLKAAIEYLGFPAAATTKRKRRQEINGSNKEQRNTICITAFDMLFY